MPKVNVENTTKQSLVVAGETVRPGATVALEKDAYDKWANGGVAKNWIKAGVVKTGGKADPETPVDPQNPTPDQETDAQKRDRLVNEARGLGLNPNANMSVENLEKAIANKKAGK